MLFSKKIDVLILNEQYSLISDEKEEAIYSAAHLVDTLLKDATESYPLQSPYKNLVLVALKLASSCHALDCQRGEEVESQKKIIDFINKELSL